MTAVLLLACLSLFVLVQEGDSRSAHIEQHVPANMLAGQSISTAKTACALGGFNFVLFGISKGNKRRLNNFLLFADFLKMYGFLRIRNQSLHKVVIHMTNKKNLTKIPTCN
jgi:hypothetical protein